jgi:hypothetical protein
MADVLNPDLAYILAVDQAKEAFDNFARKSVWLLLYLATTFYVS